MLYRPIRLETHNALVLATAPLLMIVPYLLTFTVGIGLLSFFLGTVLIGLSLRGSTPDYTLPASTHADFDWILGFTIFAIGIAAGLAGQTALTTLFLVGFGAAYLGLTASTRYCSRVA